MRQLTSSWMASRINSKISAGRDERASSGVSEGGSSADNGDVSGDCLTALCRLWVSTLVPDAVALRFLLCVGAA